MRAGHPRNRAKSWMGGENSEGPSTKTGKIVDERPECEGAVHEIGQNRGRETGILSHECVFCGERAVGLKCISQEHFMGLYQSTSLFGRLCHLRRQDLIFSWFQSDREIHAGVSLSVVIIVPPWAGRTILNTLDCNILGFQSEIADHREPVVGILILDIQTFPREVVEIFILNPCSKVKECRMLLS